MRVGLDPLMPRQLPKQKVHWSVTRLHTFLGGLAVGVLATLLFTPSDERAEPAIAAKAVKETPIAPVVEAKPSVEAPVVEAAVVETAAPTAEIVEMGPPFIPEERLIEGQVQKNQFVADLLAKAGVDADAVVGALRNKYDFRRARPGHRYRIIIDRNDQLIRFEYRAGPAEVYEVIRDGDALIGRKKKIEKKKEIVQVEGKIQHSLYDAFLKAGESENLAMSFADAFRFDVDFFHDTRKGDAFRLFVEKYTNDEGQLIEYGRVLAAEYDGEHAGKKRLFWFDGYYDENGTAAQRAFLKSPLKFTRISSGFGYRRHPILGRRHFHGGIDYAAPSGTPVQAIGEGVVTFAARKGANGKMVKIRHAGGYESFYLHLSRIQVRKGQRVSQSTVLGRVGSTGRSTGPHLDFRLKKNGRYLNPRDQVAPRVKRIARRDRSRFKRAIAPWKDRLDGKPVVASR